MHLTAHPGIRRGSPGKSRARTLSGLLLALALAGSSCAPRTRASWTLPAESAETDAALRAQPRSLGAPRALPSAAAPVPVLLTAHDGAERVELRDAGGARVVVDRVGANVRATGSAVARASEPAPVLRLPAAPRGAAWTLGDRRYAGALEFRARAGGGLTILNFAPLEEYVIGVVASELAVWSAHPAELEAQAIAARTYTLRALMDRGTSRPFLWDDVRDQMYRGVPALDASPAERKVAARVRAAVEGTRGRILVQDGRLFDARYSAACGGRSARLLDVFPEAAPFVYPASSCAPCVWIAAEESRDQRPGTWRDRVAWRLELGPEDLAKVAGAFGLGARTTSFRPVRFDAGGRWLDVEVRGDLGARTVTFGRLREVLGTARLASARVVSTSPPAGQPVESRLVLSGLGRGHGVGLCQTGARELAQRGYSAERILRNYYPAAEIVTLPGAGQTP